MIQVSPIVIGGTGGSGTRILAQLFERAGYFMGKALNDAHDAMVFEPFLDRYINPILEHTQSVDYAVEALPEALRKESVAELSRLIETYRADIPPNACGWGWKNPRSIYIWPLIHALLPQARFIHMLRDGRDMAISRNQNQTRKHFAAMFSALPAPLPDARGSIRLWQAVNLGADHFAHSSGCDYTRVRYEELCQSGAALAALQQRFSLPELPHDWIEDRGTIGRYKQLPPQQQAELMQAANTGLKTFGYL